MLRRTRKVGWLLSGLHIDSLGAFLCGLPVFDKRAMVADFFAERKGPNPKLVAAMMATLT